MVSEIVHLAGHIIDSLTLSKVLDLILREGGEYEIKQLDMGTARTDSSYAEITIRATDTGTLEHILQCIQPHGAIRSRGKPSVE